MSEIALYNLLTKIGADPEEAKEAVAEVVNTKDVATKADLADLKAELLEKIADAKHAMILWVVGTTIALFLGLSSVIFAAVGLL